MHQRSKIIKHLFLFAALIRPGDSLGVDHVLTFPYSHCLSCIVVGALVFLTCYIFYPAYTNIEGGLGCATTILAGDKKSDQDNTLSLVIPAYNEAERLPIMLDATLKYLNTNRKDLTKVFRGVGGQKGYLSELIQYEFIIVNDGSTDDTDSVVQKYATNIHSGDTVKLISMHKNVGKGGAVKAGMLQSSGQLCLMLDADGATDISDGLLKVLKEMKGLISKERSDNSSFLPPAAVFGSRAHLEDNSCASRSKIRTFLMHAFHFFVTTLCSSRIKDTQCGFKLFTRPAVVLLFTNLHLRRWAFDTEVVVIAENLNISLSEVGVIWREIDGSKLDVDKITLALVSLGMLRDMVCVRACYLLGIWKLKR
eukprot:CAMPEP_0172314330 /NCGR_PEP_ID=MMETSP1058-20130122/22255_1 /TAXON_ID=83371 /ORGANISM="Detonula confervacea, Strain CCMP 353" /LENGTH=365 /DNA_ID=CAMNT_0013028161 /DNA_START=59 /DNA_END=1156 /DNA_ORIENTATION=+